MEALRARVRRAPPVLPLAMAAVTVAGQCRERSPSDITIFGEGTTRFVERFADPAVGEALLATALAEGAAEGAATLLTGTGRAPFRVALWRQRGGQKIRVLASFAPAVQDTATGRASEASLDAGAGLRRPLASIIGLAEGLRSEGAAAGPAGDILAASWHLVRLVEELAVTAELRPGRLAPRIGEVDLARLAGRLLRLARPAADAAGVTLEPALDDGAGRSVVADEGALWVMAETLIHAGIEAAGEGSAVRIALGPGSGGGLELEVATEGDPASTPLGAVAEAAAANGARLRTGPGGGFPLRLVFPRGRCLAAG